MSTPELRPPRLFGPWDEPVRRALAIGVIALLSTSALLVLIAACAMPDAYSWRFHSISESAAQGQANGWIARLSFLCFGAAVLLQSQSMSDVWPRLTYWGSFLFAGSMLGAASFSHRPWTPNEAADQFEDLLHSVFASTAGLAFCISAMARFAQRGRRAHVGRVFDTLALAAATLMPILLATGSAFGGFAQRVMFGMAYVWFGRDALIALRLVRDSTVD